MSKCTDLSGRIFGRLTVIERASNNKWGNTRWLCQCNCISNKRVIVSGTDLKSGHTQSCGCLQKERTISARKKINSYDLSGEYGIGYTSKGEPFYFDLEDYDKIKDYCWCINNNGYVVATINNKLVLFHKVICPDSEIIDHKDHCTFNNRKYNLRYANKQQNNMNKSLQSNNTSGVTGVAWNKRRNKWVARIKVNKCDIHLGYFNNFNNAVQARKIAENKYFGEFSYDNSVKVGV